MEQETVELLIGKYFDGEITPAEQKMLQARIESDPESKELFVQLQDIHELNREAITSEVLDKGKSFDEIFENAWEHRTRNPLRRMLPNTNKLRFAAGLAAGVMIGLALNVYTSVSMNNTRGIAQVDPEIKRSMVQPVRRRAAVNRPVVTRRPSAASQNVIRNVDWYSFTDESGEQWIVEGLHEKIQPVIYAGGL